MLYFFNLVKKKFFFLQKSIVRLLSGFLFLPRRDRDPPLLRPLRVDPRGCGRGRHGGQRDEGDVHGRGERQQKDLQGGEGEGKFDIYLTNKKMRF